MTVSTDMKLELININLTPSEFVLRLQILRENIMTSQNYKGPLWSCSYGSWIYNYLCN